MQTKPSKPRPDFPLTPHPRGQWCKKIRGKIYYFGPWADPEGAEQAYLNQKPYLESGRKAKPDDEYTVADVLNRFLEFKKNRLATGEIGAITYDQYERTCKRMAEALDKHRMFDDLDSADLDQLRTHIAIGLRGKPVSKKTLTNELTRVRSVFYYANEVLLDRPVKYRFALSSPPAYKLRAERDELGPRLFEPDEIRKLLKAADPRMKAWIYLGINCAFIPADIRRLRVEFLDLEKGFHNFNRHKKGTVRRCPLWPETVEALKATILDQGLAYRSDRGLQLRTNRISLLFRRLCRDVDIYRERVTTFKSLRSTFQTIADETNVNPAVVKLIMGHIDGDISGVYRQRIKDESLLLVTNHVREWLKTD